MGDHAKGSAPDTSFKRVQSGIVWGVIFLAIFIGWKYVSWTPSNKFLIAAQLIVNELMNGFKVVGMLLLVIGAFLFFGRSLLDLIVDLYVKPPLQHLNNLAEKGINDLVRSVPTAEQLLEHIPRCDDMFTAKDVLCKIPDGEQLADLVLHNHLQQYGDHSKRTDSLYCYVNKNLLAHACIAPHKSNYTKNIRLRPSDYEDCFIWDESSTYKIHNPLVKGNGPSYSYDFKIGTSTMYTGDDPNKWLESFGLKAEVDGISGKEDIIGSQVPTEFISGNEQEYTWQRRGNWFDVEFTKTILLNKEWTDVTTSEVGLTAKVDQTYSLGVYTPYYGCEVNMTLPTGYEFIKDTDCSVANLLKGISQIPPSDYDKHFRITYLADNTVIKAKIFDWVLPGTGFNIQWRKVE